jgi:hypothetical protein
MVNKKNIIMQIYKITNLVNNKIYIGKDTTSDPNYFGSGLLINRSLTKYGKENFIKEIIDTTDDYDELSKKEIYWIEKYNSTHLEIGYNISSGGDGGDTLSNHPNLDLIKEKISKNSPKKGKTYEEAFGLEKSNDYKNKLKGKIYKSILSPQAIIKNKEKWEDYNENLKKRYQFIKQEIDNGKLYEYIDELKIIKKKSSHKFIKNADDFYKFFGDDLRYIFGKLKIRQEDEFNKLNNFITSKNIEGIISYLNFIPNEYFENRKKYYEYIGDELKLKVKIKLKSSRKKFNQETKIKIKIDNIEYDSITEASKKLATDRSKIKYRLKSPHFKNYLFKDDALNQKYRKFEDIDPHLSKKESVSIEGKEYGSITEAAKDLNITNDYITWRLNSKSYPDWLYLNKEIELKETGDPKNKKVSVLGTEYESISKAVEGTGIDRQLIRYRLRTNNYSDYFYI